MPGKIKLYDSEGKGNRWPAINKEDYYESKINPDIKKRGGNVRVVPGKTRIGPLSRGGAGGGFLENLK
jgi:hypothetical protein